MLSVKAKRKYHREYYAKNRETILAVYKERYAADPSLRAAKSQYRKKWWDEVKLDASRFKIHILRRARHRAKKYGLPFNLSLDDFHIPTHCPVFGFKLRVAEGRHDDRSPALDRIIPKLGYVKGNVTIISQRANVLKRDASLQEIEKLVRYLRRITK